MLSFFPDGSIDFVQDNPSSSTSESCSEKQVVTLHGIVLRSQLVTLLKKGVFYSEVDGVSNTIIVSLEHYLFTEILTIITSFAMWRLTWSLYRRTRGHTKYYWYLHYYMTTRVESCNWLYLLTGIYFMRAQFYVNIQIFCVDLFSIWQCSILITIQPECRLCARIT